MHNDGIGNPSHLAGCDKKGVGMTEGNRRMVVKHNDLIRAGYKLGLNEQRLVLTCIARLDSVRGKLPTDNLFRVTADEFADQWNMSQKKAYEALAEASDSLYERDIKLRKEKTQTRMRWVYMVKYHPGEGRVDLGFSPTVAPYLTQLRREFTSYGLDSVAGLRSAYSIRLFEMLMQWKSTGACRITLTEFREALELQDRYPRFVDLKRRVIDQAVNELKLKSNLEIEYDVHRKGQKPFALTFFFGENPQGTLPLDTPPQPRRRKMMSREALKDYALPGENWPQLMDRLKRDGYQLAPERED